MGELDLIARIREAARRAGALEGPELEVGIGDDAAVLRPRTGEDLVWTVDDQVEAIHFRRRWARPRDIGSKAAGAALSDLAAMGARPVGALLAIEIPPELRDDEIVELATGLCQVLARHRCPLAGGNVTSRPGGSGLSLSVSAIGAVKRGQSLLRSGAKAGDVLLASGLPGLARAGLLALERNLAGKPPLAPAIERFLRPEPRIALGLALAKRKNGRPSAAMDISDGLAGDAAKLAAASGLGAVIEQERLPLEELRSMATLLDERPVDLATIGGEDYELLVAADPGHAPALAALSKDAPLRIVGRLVPAKDVRGAVLEDSRGKRTPLALGYDHRAG